MHPEPNSSPTHSPKRDSNEDVPQNLRFNQAIDESDDEEFQVLLRKPNPDSRSSDDKYLEIPLSKPSQALVAGDPIRYKEEAERFEISERERILNTHQFARNQQRFDDLKNACRRGFVIPFVGAGMSKSAGCPDWKEYLLKLSKEARMDVKAVRKRLEVGADYERVLNDVVQKLGIGKFNQDFERDFKTKDMVSGAVTYLPRLFDGCVVTTNFDCVLEDVYANGAQRFAEKVNGVGRTGAFLRAIPAGGRHLLKLHGNLDNPAERVLNLREYSRAYGKNGGITFERPIPKILRRLFMSYTFLFLGCSLSADRTMRVFTKAATLQGHDDLPNHYAILQCSSDPADEPSIEQRLSKARISPIYYPEGEHEFVEEILDLLLA